MDDKITVSVEDIQTAVEQYRLLTDEERKGLADVMPLCPTLGLQIAAEIQAGLNAAKQNRAAAANIFNYAIHPAFVIGLLTGREQGKRQVLAVKAEHRRIALDSQLPATAYYRPHKEDDPSKS